ncbi:MAG: indolepyruvate oxidoreductase subunit beta family protein [Candidatus Rokubacteria bacterium]|nr:indolepyruvate oxidoreductase subunit beta family protein [Candidatus Rokubacteria bacterium]
MSDSRLATLLIPAVGGQGGGVLSEWIVDAAGIAGLRAHGTSIPGVAQRTGSTTYYVEIASGDAPPDTAFSLYPIPGALDVLLAPELLEVGRMIELGFPSPARTTIIASTHRLYSIHEKITTAGDVYPSERLVAAARAFARELVAFDALALAREHETEANAILLGALAGSGAFPIPADAYRAAIEAKGIRVRSNLNGFDVGLERAGARETTAPSPRAVAGNGAGARRRAEDPRVASLPAPVRAIAGEAVARLVDYQDDAYADRYLARLRPFLGGDGELAALVARHLAVWMTYEDAIRVADLKTRAARFARIRRDARAAGAEVVVTDYLKPDLDEIYGILPYRLVRGFAAWAERRWPRGRPTLGQHVKTTTISGYLRLWLLARARRLRPASYRAHHEHARMERWLAAVARAAGWDVELARELARAAGLVKGYGDVRRRMSAVFDDLLAQVMRAAELGAARGDVGVARDLVRRYRALVREGPDAEERGAALARTVVTALEAGDSL